MSPVMRAAKLGLIAVVVAAFSGCCVVPPHAWRHGYEGRNEGRYDDRYDNHHGGRYDNGGPGPQRGYPGYDGPTH